jgi:hypothetical protein
MRTLALSLCKVRGGIFQDVALLAHVLAFGFRSPYLGVPIQFSLPHDIGLIELRFPGIQTVRGDARSLRHARQRMTVFSYRLDCRGLERIHLPLAARSDILGCHKPWFEEVCARLAGSVPGDFETGI